MRNDQLWYPSLNLSLIIQLSNTTRPALYFSLIADLIQFYTILLLRNQATRLHSLALSPILLFLWYECIGQYISGVVYKQNASLHLLCFTNFHCLRLIWSVLWMIDLETMCQAVKTWVNASLQVSTRSSTFDHN